MYRRTCLNVHPCVYDAYGMTVVEAAAFGAPSCVQRGDLVGCAALLRQSEMEFIPVDWTLNSEADLMTTESSPTDDHVADVVEGYLRAGWDGVHAGDSLSCRTRGVAVVRAATLHIALRDCGGVGETRRGATAHALRGSSPP